MKKIILCLTVLILLFPNCNKNCKIKRPKDVKPIDWENYNSVYDVMWNYADYNVSSDMGKTIKVCGWVFQGSHGLPVNPLDFNLIDKEKNIFNSNPWENGRGIYVRIGSYYRDNYETLIDSLKIKFDMADITKKCYITGTLSYFTTNDGCGEHINPEIRIDNANDIYFK